MSSVHFFLSVVLAMFPKTFNTANDLNTETIVTSLKVRKRERDQTIAKTAI